MPQRKKKKVVRSVKSSTTRVRKVTRRSTPVRRRKVVVATPVKKSRRIDWAASYTSLLLGIVVVIIGVLFIASLLRVNRQQSVSSISTQVTPTTETEKNTQNPQTYIVQEGDDLWHISEKFYNDGYKWVEIAKANNITNPGMIFKGDKLTLPRITTPTPSNLGQIITTPTPTVNQEQAIKTDTYMVKEGDNLWNIAVRAYADGYRWPDIAKANNITNPGLIFKGDTLKLPR